MKCIEEKEEVLPEEKPWTPKHRAQTRGFSTQRLRAEPYFQRCHNEYPRRHSWPIFLTTRISSDTTEFERVIREMDYRKLERRDDNSPERSRLLWLCTRRIVHRLLPLRERNSTPRTWRLQLPNTEGNSHNAHGITKRDRDYIGSSTSINGQIQKKGQRERQKDEQKEGRNIPHLGKTFFELTSRTSRPRLHGRISYKIGILRHHKDLHEGKLEPPQLREIYTELLNSPVLPLP